MAQPPEKEEPVFAYARGVAQIIHEEPEVRLYFDQLRTERRTADVSAELRVFGPLNGSTKCGPLHRTRLNLTSARGRADAARYLQTRLTGIDWPAFLEDACWMVIDAHRQGQKSILLRDAQAPAGGEVLLPPLLLAREPVVMFGDGGNAKSYLALALALSVQGARPLVGGLKPTAQLRTAYLDFEWYDWPHRKRMAALWGDGELPDLEYVPCQAEGPLTQQVDRLRGIFHDRQIEFAVIDSIALACDGPPEDAQVALAFFQALARLEVGSLLLAHINKSGDTDKPFGSTFWHNSARATWYVQRVQEAGDTSLDLGLYQRKVNDGTPAPALGLRFDFTADRTTINRTDLRRVPELASRLPLKARMVAELRQGALTINELADRLSVSPDTVRVTFKRHEDKTFKNLGGDPYRVGLLTP